MWKSLKSFRRVNKLVFMQAETREKKHLFKRERCRSTEHDVICYFALSCCFIFSHQFLDFAANEKVMSSTGRLNARSHTITLAHRILVPKSYKPPKLLD